MNSLHSLHGQFVIDHFLIFDLKTLKDDAILMSSGTRSHIFGPNTRNVSLPHIIMLFPLKIMFDAHIVIYIILGNKLCNWTWWNVIFHFVHFNCQFCTGCPKKKYPRLNKYNCGLKLCISLDICLFDGEYLNLEFNINFVTLR